MERPSEELVPVFLGQHSQAAAPQRLLCWLAQERKPLLSSGHLLSKEHASQPVGGRTGFCTRYFRRRGGARRLWCFRHRPLSTFLLDSCSCSSLLCIPVHLQSCRSSHLSTSRHATALYSLFNADLHLFRDPPTKCRQVLNTNLNVFHYACICDMWCLRFIPNKDVKRV